MHNWRDSRLPSATGPTSSSRRSKDTHRVTRLWSGAERRTNCPTSVPSAVQVSLPHNAAISSTIRAEGKSWKSRANSGAIETLCPREGHGKTIPAVILVTLSPCPGRLSPQDVEGSTAHLCGHAVVRASPRQMGTSNRSMGPSHWKFIPTTMGHSAFLNKPEARTVSTPAEPRTLIKSQWELRFFGTKIQSVRPPPAMGAWPTQTHSVSSLGLEQATLPNY